MLLLGIVIILAIILVTIFVTGKYEKLEVVKSSYALGTIINLKAYGRKAEKAILEAIEALNNIDDKMSTFKESSEISGVNKSAGISSEIVSEDTYAVIQSALKHSEILEGTFDPTIRPLVKLWNIGTEEERVPKKSEIEDALKLVNYKDVLLDEKSHSIKLKHKNQALDVGGIAKGFAADKVRNIFHKNNIKSALIDLGGNIFALGSKEDNSPWKVGIQNPFSDRGEYIGILNVRNKSIVTSGNYERYFIKDGKRYHHIIDPRTGNPSLSEIISATIISDNSIDGDGLSTGAYILGVDKTIEIIEVIEGIDAILVTEAKEVYITSGIKDSFNITHEEFILKDMTSEDKELK